MPLPDPHPGLVIRYAYLWYDEYRAGRENAAKSRPCAVILATQDDDGHLMVTAVPVTHTPPSDVTAALEIPPQTAQRLGLDDDRSWIVFSEVNRFLWPGPDLETIPGRPGTFHYGVLPPKFFDKLRTRLVALARNRRSRTIVRSD